MAVPVRPFYSQGLKLIVKRKGRIESTDIVPVLFVPMSGEEVKKRIG